MKPERRTRYAAAITLSKGKMYEYGVPEAEHLTLPPDLDLDMQFPLAIGTIGDFAAERATGWAAAEADFRTPRGELIFSAQVLQAFDESLLKHVLSWDLRLLSAAAFYLGDQPGNSIVQLAKLAELPVPAGDWLGHAVRVALSSPWDSEDATQETPATALLAALKAHFDGLEADEAVHAHARTLRKRAYAIGTPHELLLADILAAVSAKRLRDSAQTLLPQFSDLPRTAWADYLGRSTAIREMWPSQRLLGDAGLFKGRSGVVQMPTSAGKSRATELLIRAAFLAARTKLALVIAPFRALCQELASNLEQAFRSDGFQVNQLSDALQPDVAAQLFDVTIDPQPQVVVVTPEKLLYMLRQNESILQDAGLVVYDEGHQFDTGPRGVTYELLLTSIKRSISPATQVVLISAVIQNASAVANWLLGAADLVVSDSSLQGRRMIAHVSLPLSLSGQLQFNVASESEQPFFVPRVVTMERQKRQPRETKDRFFPTKESGSIALYLGLRLVHNGGVAIFCGKKSSAAKIVRDAIEDVFGRGISLPPPSECANPHELLRFSFLYEKNFGADCYLTRAAALGLFAHHGNTPHGIRLAIEYAMRERLIRLIVCTSTLAQGVNLPIRYLLVTSSMQGRESIKARDFHNLMGRAGRAGMYGEGTVIFTDHRLFDERSSEARRWNESLKLVDPNSPEPTSSTLLSLFQPLTNDPRTRILAIPEYDLVARIATNWSDVVSEIPNIGSALMTAKFSRSSLEDQLSEKKAILEQIESFLMTNRGNADLAAFVESSRSLASQTLAYALASEKHRTYLADLFELIARRIEASVPDMSNQLRFGRTLLGVDQSLAIDEWVEGNPALLQITSAAELLVALWPLLLKLSSRKKLASAQPEGTMLALAQGWIAGEPFSALLQAMNDRDSSYAFGAKRRKFDIDLIIEECEQTFGFEFALLLAAVRESYIASSAVGEGEQFSDQIDVLQKMLRYGLANREAIYYFEAGFSDRVIAQSLASELWWLAPSSVRDVRRIAREAPVEFASVLEGFPSYFMTNLEKMLEGGS